MKRNILFAIAIALFATSMFAGQLTGISNTVSATVNGHCTVLTPFALSFPNYDATLAAGDAGTIATSNLELECTKNANVTVSLSKGDYSTATERGMAGTAPNTDKLYYQIFTDNTATTVWGVAADFTGATTVAVSGAGIGNSTNVPVYGVVRAGQDVTPDTYNDIVLATINF